MPGVTVTLSGPALITPQSTVSLESGAYRFPSIPIGLYSVTFELPGFKRFVRQNVRIETGFNAEIDRRPLPHRKMLDDAAAERRADNALVNERHIIQ